MLSNKLFKSLKQKYICGTKWLKSLDELYKTRIVVWIIIGYIVAE